MGRKDVWRSRNGVCISSATLFFFFFLNTSVFSFQYDYVKEKAQVERLLDKVAGCFFRFASTTESAIKLEVKMQCTSHWLKPRSLNLHTFHRTTPLLLLQPDGAWVCVCVWVCACMWVRLYLFHVACEGVIIAEAVTFNDIQTRTCTLWAFFSAALFLNQRRALVGWPGINGTCHMWDIRLRIKTYFQRQIERNK